MTILAAAVFFNMMMVASTSALQTAATSPVASTGPFPFSCDADGGVTEVITVTFYRTTPGLALIVRAGQARPAFQVRAASGAKYEGEGLLFWEARGEATVTWLGTGLKCKRT